MDKEFRECLIITGIICLCTGLFSMAYPEGKVNDAVLACVKKHYDMAFVAEVSPEEKQTMYTLQRYGVFSWNEHIESIFRNR